MLVSVVDACVWINRPHEYRIDATVTLLKIIEIAVNRVFPGDGIVQIAIMHHHLGLYKAVLGPLKLRQIVAGPVIADANAALRAPMRLFGEPVAMRRQCTNSGSGTHHDAHRHAWWCEDELACGISKLCIGLRSEDSSEKREACGA